MDTKYEVAVAQMSSPFYYLLTGALCGCALALLFGTKRGRELRDDIGKTYDRVKAFPGRVTTAAAVGAAKGAAVGAGQGVFREIARR